MEVHVQRVESREGVGLLTLTLEKRGLDFYNNEQEWSDCTNHRLFMDFIDTKDGKRVCGSFMHGARWDFSGAKPKKISENRQMFADLQYIDVDGLWRAYNHVRSVIDYPYYGKDYTLQNILDYVNSFSKEHYDEVEIV